MSPRLRLWRRGVGRNLEDANLSRVAIDLIRGLGGADKGGSLRTAAGNGGCQRRRYDGCTRVHDAGGAGGAGEE